MAVDPSQRPLASQLVRLFDFIMRNVCTKTNLQLYIDFRSGKLSSAFSKTEACTVSEHNFRENLFSFRMLPYSHHWFGLRLFLSMYVLFYSLDATLPKIDKFSTPNASLISSYLYYTLVKNAELYPNVCQLLSMFIFRRFHIFSRRGSLWNVKE